MHQREAMDRKNLGTVVTAKKTMNVGKIRNNDDDKAPGSGQICVLLDDRLMIVEMLHEALRKHQIVLPGWNKLEEITMEKLRIGYAVKEQVFARVRYPVGVVNA
jgi:hypothetical protein